MAGRRAPWNAQKNELRYLRRDGNRMVRAKRRRRTAARMTVVALLWVAGAFCAVVACAFAQRWATSPAHFRLAEVVVRGNHEARQEEIQQLAQAWMGKNIFVITLPDLEKKVREHPWIGAGGTVRIQRRVPGSLVITVGERQAAGLALLGGVVWLVDGNGMPIDRYGPRYPGYDFPIIKGLDGLKADAAASPAGKGAARLADALATGVAVTRTLSEKEPAFYAQASEIDVSEPGMIVLRLDAESYDLRLSREDYLRNLENYFALRDQIRNDDTGAIEYVDLRWQDRIAVMPAATKAAGSDTNRHELYERIEHHALVSGGR